MDHQMKEAFDQIHADARLIENTKRYLAQKAKKRRPYLKRLSYVTACFLFVLFAGYGLYYTPTTYISIDINPSIEISVNRFDKVIGLEAYNDDGAKLIETLDLKYQDYQEAVQQILNSEQIEQLLAADEEMLIAVVGDESPQSQRILMNLEKHCGHYTNTSCYFAQHHDLKEAHDLGMSYGKYQAYLEIQALDTNYTAEDISKMTMKEVKQLLSELSKTPTTQPHENGHHWQKGHE